MAVSADALESAALKAVKQFSLVKSTKVKINITGKSLEIKLRLVLWTSNQITSLLSEIQHAVLGKVRRLVGRDTKVVVACDVKGVDESEELSSDAETKQ